MTRSFPRMPAGTTISNAISGETFHFLKTHEDTSGTLLEFDCTVTPGGRLAAPQAHIHPKSDETFDIYEGHLRTVVNGTERVYGPGERVFIPAGTPHIWFNASQTQSVRFKIQLTNPGAWEYVFALVFRLANTGQTRPDGSVPLLKMAAVLHAYPDHYYLAGPPIWAQKALFAALAGIAKFTGAARVLDGPSRLYPA